MITLQDYFGHYANHKDATPARWDNAEKLMVACEKLEALMVLDGVEFPVNPATGTQVSGSGNGGFRPQECSIGAPKSSHKEALAVDRYDPHGAIDAWCMAHAEKGGLLEECGIYIEHPDSTKGWSHWTIKRPGSGNRVFRP